LNRIAALAGFGMGLIGFGFFYELFDQVYIRYITPYVRPSVYNTGEAFLWDILPWMAILLGIFCLMVAGISYRTTTTKGGGGTE